MRSILEAHSPIGERPANEAVARELAPLRNDPERLHEAWAEAVEHNGEKPTAVQTRDVVRDLVRDGPRDGGAQGDVLPHGDVVGGDCLCRHTSSVDSNGACAHCGRLRSSRRPVSKAGQDRALDLAGIFSGWAIMLPTLPDKRIDELVRVIGRKQILDDIAEHQRALAHLAKRIREWS